MTFAEWAKKRSLNEDIGHSLIPPNIPRTQTGLIGNELRTDAGRSSRERVGEGEGRFQQSVDNFKKRITELPVPRIEKQVGLGDLGMKMIGQTTFGQ